MSYGYDTSGKLDDKKMRPLKMQGRRSLLNNLGSRNNLRSKHGVLSTTQSVAGAVGMRADQTQASSSPNLGFVQGGVNDSKQLNN